MKKKSKGDRSVASPLGYTPAVGRAVAPIGAAFCGTREVVGGGLLGRVRTM